MPLDAEEEARILSEVGDRDFTFGVELWEQFLAAVEEMTGRGVKVLLFTPPIHPLVMRTEMADIDGTSREDYEDIVGRLEALEADNELVFFEDIHRGGAHDIPHEEFSDEDHLRTVGAERVTKKLVEIIEKNSE
jgi:hypothetical protein